MTIATYIHATIRFVPDPVRGEFVNIGVIAGNDERDDWSIRLVANDSRARRFDTADVLPVAMSTAKLWSARLAARTGRNTAALAGEDRTFPSTRWLTETAGRNRSVVQLAPPMRVSARSAEEAVNIVFPLIVEEGEKRRSNVGVGRAKQAMRDAYRTQLITRSNLLQRGILHAGPRKRSVDFAVANGRVVQIAQTVALNVSNEQTALDKIGNWAFIIEHLKGEGGSLQTPKRVIDIPSTVDVAMVIVRRSATGSDVDDEAWDVLRSVDAMVHTADDASEIATRAAASLQAAQHRH